MTAIHLTVSGIDAGMNNLYRRVDTLIESVGRLEGLCTVQLNQIRDR
jgi:hypothetical protein